MTDPTTTDSGIDLDSIELRAQAEVYNLTYGSGTADHHRSIELAKIVLALTKRLRTAEGERDIYHDAFFVRDGKIQRLQEQVRSLTAERDSVVLAYAEFQKLAREWLPK